MRIAQVSPLYEAVPPKLYGGTERVVAHLCDPLVSISNDQRKPLPFANWAATVHHGLDEGLYRFEPRSRGYLAFLGRISPEKRPDRAIAIATRLGKTLRIAAKVDAADRVYFDE